MPPRSITKGIDVDKLDSLINDLGVRVKIFKSTLCPNMKSLETLDHDINCTVCNNNMIDFDCHESIAMFQQQTLQEQFTVQGSFHIDEIMVSFLAGESLQHFTRIDLLDFEEDFFELIQRQESTTIDRLKYSACSIIAVFVIRSDVLIRFHFGSDFTLDVNGDIKWLGLNKPNDREIYSVYYKYHPVFRAIKAVHRDRYSQFNLRPDQIKAPKKTINGKTYVKLPETWILKRDYLLERRDLQNALLANNTFYNPND